MLNQSEIEQHYFEMFRKHYPLPDGIVEYGDKPDVILRGERTIGIEMTNFFLEEGHSLKVSNRKEEHGTKSFQGLNALTRPRAAEKSSLRLGLVRVSRSAMRRS